MARSGKVKRMKGCILLLPFVMGMGLGLVAFFLLGLGQHSLGYFKQTQQSEAQIIHHVTLPLVKKSSPDSTASWQSLKCQPIQVSFCETTDEKMCSEV